MGCADDTWYWEHLDTSSAYNTQQGPQLQWLGSSDRYSLLSVNLLFVPGSMPLHMRAALHVIFAAVGLRLASSNSTLLFVPGSMARHTCCIMCRLGRYMALLRLLSFKSVHNVCVETFLSLPEVTFHACSCTSRPCDMGKMLLMCIQVHCVQ